MSYSLKKGENQRNIILYLLNFKLFSLSYSSHRIFHAPRTETRTYWSFLDLLHCSASSDSFPFFFFLKFRLNEWK